MKLSDLWDMYSEDTIAYIYGSGPSLQFFADSYELFSRDAISIGLNQAYKSLNFAPTYNLTIHPELIKDGPNLTWITKRKGWLVRTPIEDYYYFSNNPNVKNFDYLEGKANTLYVGRGIHTAACCLAARMGIRTAVLIGCDMTAIGGDHHATEQSVRFHNLPPHQVYKEYYLNLVEVRKRLYNLYGFKIYTLSPYIGQGYHQEDYLLRRDLEKIPRLSHQIYDDSDYSRDCLDFS